MLSRSIVWNITLLVCVGHTALNCSKLIAEEPYDPEQAFAQGEDGFLYAFCEKSLLIDRGICCDSFLIYGTDNWILEELIKQPGFKEALSKIPDLSEYSTDKRDAKPPVDGEKETRSDVWMTNASFQDDLLEKLTEDEARRLPGVYLRLEGFSALVRPHFTKLFDDPSTQKKIEQTFKKNVEPAAIYFKRFFYPPGMTDEEFVVCHAAQRRASADLDREIVKLLSKAERKKIIKLLKDSSELDRIVIPPPLHR